MTFIFKYKLFLLITLTISQMTYSKQIEIITNFKNSAYPNEMRETGHYYGNKHYPKKEHYNNQESLIYIPKNFRAKNKINFLVYYHGWNNNIRKANKEFLISNQLEKSGVNAILIFPEGPVNAPDSFGGNHEKKGIFSSFIYEVLDTLTKRNIIDANSAPGKIILAGHSGAYRVIAKIIDNSELTNHIKEIFLFDGLYSFEDVFVKWIKNCDCRFINIFTKNGGTFELSNKLNRELWSLKKYIYAEEHNLQQKHLETYDIINIFSSLGHNMVIHTNNQLELFLKTSIITKGN